jgi:hypothetical protein
MIQLIRVVWFIALVSALLVPQHAGAQVPPHVPGTICFTPAFWCWAQPPGAPGLPCACQGPTGPVQGVLG